MDKKRIPELDLLKCLFIVLMVCFHLAWFSAKHPYAHEVVYTFHMPGFLIISGFLTNISKPGKQFARYLLFLIIPYLIMESGYIVMASILPINDHIDGLNITLFLNKLFLNPVGPYWYIQTIIICETIYYLVFKYLRFNTITLLLITGILFYLLSVGLDLYSFTYSMYFLTGAVIRQSGLKFTDIFKPSAVAIIAFAILICFEHNLKPSTGGGILIAYSAISSALFVFQYINGKASQFLQYLGRNSLLIYLFSPIFTILCKVMIPFLSFDNTGLIFMVVSVIICISGSLGIGYLMDITKLSRLFFGRDRIVS